jgi:glucuronokinase
MSVEGRCCARIGLMGNPSDGFEGKTLSFLLDNFSARVFIKQVAIAGVHIKPHPVHDGVSFASLEGLTQHLSVTGYTGGVRLIQATCKKFHELVTNANKSECLNNALSDNKGWEISYDTDIPRMVGLSGSSAIIVATMRALLAYHGLVFEDLGIELHRFPRVILNIEKMELGIAAGLQDRVVQVYGGMVHMDFSLEATSGGLDGVFRRLEDAPRPKLYLAYNTTQAGDSGKVHSTVGPRWAARDPELVQGMKELGTLADRAAGCVEHSDWLTLASLIGCNFALRCKLYGTDVVGAKNIAAVEVCKTNSVSMAAKFTGSGGALVCLRADGVDEWLTEDEESAWAKALEPLGFVATRVRFAQ